MSVCGWISIDGPLLSEILKQDYRPPFCFEREIPHGLWLTIESGTLPTPGHGASFDFHLNASFIIADSEKLAVASEWLCSVLQRAKAFSFYGCRTPVLTPQGVREMLEQTHPAIAVWPDGSVGGLL